MKRTCLLLSVFFVLPSCSSISSQGLDKNFSIQQFDTWGYEKQAAFINNLERKSKMQFMSLFLQDRLFVLPPVAYVVFLRNGEFVNEAQADDQEGGITQKYGKFFTGHWSYANDQILVGSNDPDVDFGKQQIWDDVWVAKDDVGKDGAILTVHVLKEQKHDGSENADFNISLHDWGKQGNFGPDEHIKSRIEKKLEGFK
jgi:hypothetical protein